MNLKFKIRDYVMGKSRGDKFNQLMNYLKPSETDNFLDAGVSGRTDDFLENYTIKKYPYKNRITGLGINDLTKLNKEISQIRTVVYDGKIFPFKDKEFKISHSNAVIEHVGDYDSQKLFLSEMVRVSERGMLTTPNKFFPIETHYLIPFLHWNDKMFNRFKHKRKDNFTVSLLSRKDLINLCREINVPNYRVVENKFLGMNMTFSLFWADKESYMNF